MIEGDSMRLRDEQYEFIKEEVIALFVRYDVNCIPISGFELAIKMGITLIPYSSLSSQKRKVAMKISQDGFFLEGNDGRNRIYYNDLKSYQRINITILHEIGHCVLDHQSGTDEEEAEAKFFAKYASAPPPLVHRIRPHTPKEIKQVFDLSYEASVYAFDYYRKWLFHCSGYYKDYEKRLLGLFLSA